MSDENKKIFTRKEFEERIIAQAWKDPEYKKRLLDSPREVLEEELKSINPEAKLPDNIKVFVHEEKLDAVHISLPVNPADLAETGEEWLEDVSGGFIAVSIVVVAALAVVGALAATVHVAGNVNVTANVNVNVNVHLNRK